MLHNDGNTLGLATGASTFLKSPEIMPLVKLVPQHNLWLMTDNVLSVTYMLILRSQPYSEVLFPVTACLTKKQKVLLFF